MGSGYQSDAIRVLRRVLDQARSDLEATRADGVFDDRVTKIMGAAFDSACKELHDRGQPEVVYEVIAKRIIDAARNGERDPLRLRDAGLAALGFDRR